MMNIILFCVNYNSYDELNCYLSSLERSLLHSNINLTVNITDNSDVKANIENKYSFKLQTFESDKNLGYFNGISYGISKANVSLDNYDYCIFSNVDIVVNNDFFRSLEKFEVYQDVGLIAPSIFTKKYIDLNPMVLSRYSIDKLKVLRFIFKHPVSYFIKDRIVEKFRTKRKFDENVGYIYAAYGSFMIFTRKSFEFIKSMHCPLFLFGEEIFVGENLKDLKLKTIYTDRLIVYDLQHISTRRLGIKSICKYSYDSINTIINTYYFGK